MSPVQERIPIPIVYQFIKDDTKDVTKIKQLIHQAIVRGIMKAIEATWKLAELIIPESDPARYPPSYISEQLMESYLAFLQSEKVRIKSGPNYLRDSYYIKMYDWKAHTSYAEYVNEMRNVRWSKPTSQTNFMETLDNFLTQSLDAFIEHELEKVDTGLALLYEVL